MQKGRSEASKGVGRKKCWWWWEGSGGGGKQGPEEPTNMKPALQVGHCVLLCTVYRNIGAQYHVVSYLYCTIHTVPQSSKNTFFSSDLWSDSAASYIN